MVDEVPVTKLSPFDKAMSMYQDLSVDEDNLSNGELEYNEINKEISAAFNGATAMSPPNSGFLTIKTDQLGEGSLELLNDIWKVNKYDNTELFIHKYKSLQSVASLNASPTGTKNQLMEIKSVSPLQARSEDNVIAKNNHAKFGKENVVPKNLMFDSNNYYPKSFNKNDNHLNYLRNVDQVNVDKRTTFLDDKQNRIILENIMRGKDKRTTLMIRHIPNKYTMKSFLEEINGEFENKYDLFYLPIDYINNCNLGFAFINFVHPMHIVQFYSRYRGRKWRKFNSEKICELAYAKFQGRRDLIAHFEKGSVLNYATEDKRPLILPTPSTLPKIQMPMKFMSAIQTMYPYGSFSYIGEDTFTIESLYNF